MTARVSCDTCGNQHVRPMWVECLHPDSGYQVVGVRTMQFHTTAHMLKQTDGFCKLYTKRKETA